MEITSASYKIDFINRWFLWFRNHTNTFEGALGRSLAYLWPAIADDGMIAEHRNSAIVRLLYREGVSPSDEIWKYIEIEQ